MWPNPQFPADLVTFTEETLNGKLHFLCNVCFPDYGDIFLIYSFINSGKLDVLKEKIRAYFFDQEA